jgi:hypothetical protein
MNTTDRNVVDPLVSLGATVDGFISSRLMAAYQLDDGHVIHVSRAGQTGHRIAWSYVLERDGVTIFEASDFSAGTDLSYGEAARAILGFLTLQEGDTDSEYFENYTFEQVAWRDEYAENLSLFALDPEDFR